MNLRYTAYKLNQWTEKRIRSSGYSERENFLDIFLNIGIASSILLFAAPITIVLAVLIKLQDGGPVFYRGLRYGRNKKTFYMYKFRTLVPNAEAIVGGKLLSSEMNLETPIGKFLRDSRLDEIPQLINVLKGDMVLIGPRPERPAVYESMCKDIPDYDLRFNIKPGVLGFSQLFTPHGADKKIRARIDNHYAKQSLDVVNSLIFVVYSLSLLTGIALKKVAVNTSKKISIFYSVQRFSDYRKYTRIRFLFSQQTRILLTFKKHNSSRQEWKEVTAYIFDINDKHLSVISDYVFPELETDDCCYGKMIIYSSAHLFDRRKSRRTIFCDITEITKSQRRDYQDSYRYLLTYDVKTKLNRYRMDKYVLNKSIL